MTNAAPRVLFFDIETAPILAFVWELFDQNVGLNQIKGDWHVLAWAAMWLEDSDDKVMYMDQRNAADIENDRDLLKAIWDLLDEADIVVTQNGDQFDIKKLNARFVILGMKPPSPFRRIDTKKLAKKHFRFTSNRLEYLTDKLAPEFRKSKHDKFPGFELWRECLRGNAEAWDEMEKYNKVDVLGLRAVYRKLAPWDTTINFGVYYGEHVCKCGSRELKKRGFYYTPTQKYQCYRCVLCGAQYRDKASALSPSESKAIPRGTNR